MAYEEITPIIIHNNAYLREARFIIVSVRATAKNKHETSSSINLRCFTLGSMNKKLMINIHMHMRSIFSTVYNI